MKVDVLLGLQWGDEGKGKIVDVLTPGYNVIARFQGGPNAGHTLKFNETQHVLHTIPSGIFRENAMNIIGNGVVIDPKIFKTEIEKIEALGIDIRKKLQISNRAHLIIPTHIALDHAYETAKGVNKIGSTKKGIGPTYTDKIARVGLRIGDIKHDFEAKYKKLKESHMEILKDYNFDFDIEAYEKLWMKGIDLIKSFETIDSEFVINQHIKDGHSILAEGAQGTLLDIEFGSYPFVTSSNTITAGACTGLGIAPNNIGKVFGIFKAYCTRVGSGPFPTELFDEVGPGATMRKIGKEFGSTTGRPRRCGWLDMPALKYSIMINGVSDLIMMKSDVLSGFDSIKVCTSYISEGKEIDYIPFDDQKVEPVYTEFKGWKTDICNASTFDELPAEFKTYVTYIEKETGVKITIISVGPERDKTIIR
jgi:adenylosuccinate synthase